MNTEALLLRSPLLARDSGFRGYRFRSSQSGATQPFQQLIAAIAAGRRAHGLCMIDDTGPGMSDLLPDVPEGVILPVAPDCAETIPAMKARKQIPCARVDGSDTPLPEAFGAADYVWWECSPDANLQVLSKRSQRLSGKRIAGGINTRETLADVRELGVSFFEGGWYKRIQGNSKSVAPAQATVIELIDLVRTEAPIGRIEPLLKRDATLSFRLLRYINSAGFGLSCEIQSFKHAVSILGYQNLTRWLSLLLATAGATPAAPVLMREAAARGRLMELLGEACVSADERDNLFIVGVFSMLPAILQVPMPALMEQLHLAETITDALLTRGGLFGPILTVAEGVEGEASPELESTVADLQLSTAQVNRFHLEAIAWAEQITA
jgi:hypothetical protein